MLICSTSLGHLNSKKGGMNAQNVMRTDAIVAPIEAGIPASRPVANMAGTYIAKRKSVDAQPPPNRKSVAIATAAKAIAKAAAE